jgi:hypothetical protein
MAESVLIQPYCLVNAVDLSAYVEDIQVNNDAALQQFVTGNPGGTVVYQRRLVGPVDFNIVVKFSDDFAAGKVDPTLRAAFGTSFVIVVGLFGSTPSATNPVTTATVVYDKLQAGGQVGNHLEKSMTFYLASGVPVTAVA